VERYIVDLQWQLHSKSDSSSNGKRTTPGTTVPPTAASAAAAAADANREVGDDNDDDDSDLPDLEGTDGKLYGDEEAPEAEEPFPNELPFPPVYSGSGEGDMDAASEAKMAASDAKDAGDWEKALEQYTTAVLAAQPSALLYANRAHVLLQLERPRAAIRDCDLALTENPDSAKALRIRGKARKALHQYEAALADLSASQQIDFDEGTVDDLKFLADVRVQKERQDAEARLKSEAQMRRRAEELKKAREEEKKAKAAAASTSQPRGSAAGGGGSPFGGGMGGGGGFPGMGGGGMGGGMEGMMGEMMKDPELLAALQNPKVIAALSQVMGAGGMPNPAKMQELMRYELRKAIDVESVCFSYSLYNGDDTRLVLTPNSPFVFLQPTQSDPEVGPVLQKLMGKMAGKMPGSAGMGGGGFPGGGASGGHDDDDDGDMPDLDDLPDLE